MSKKGKIIAIVSVITVVLIIAITLIVLFVFPGVLKKSNKKSEDKKVEEETSKKKLKEDDDEDEEKEEERTSKKRKRRNKEETTEEETTEEETTEEETTEEKTTEEKTTEQETTKAQLDVNNVELPVESDFDWLTQVAESGYPTDSKILMTGSEVNGMWKATFQYTDVGQFEEVTVKEYLTLEIQAGDVAANIIVKPYLVKIDGEEYTNDYGSEYSLDGRIDTGSISVYGDYANIDINVFYEYQGKQYGFGMLTNPSGEKSIVGLVRP